MSRFLIALLLCFATSAPAFADEFPTDDTQALADQYGLNAMDLEGAVNTTRMTAQQYLQAVGVIPLPVPQVAAKPIGHTAYVRVTHYNFSGITANGGSTYTGGTACSGNFAFGTTFTFMNGMRFVCNDRGRLYYNPATEDGWLDLWRVPYLDGHARVVLG